MSVQAVVSWWYVHWQKPEAQQLSVKLNEITAIKSFLINQEPLWLYLK